MRKNVVLFVLAWSSLQAFSQAPMEHDAIIVPINALFKGMHDGDSALVHSAFVNQVTFVSVSMGENGKPVLQPEPLSDFLKAVGTSHPETWNEVIWDTKIQMDGIFAQVWAPYAFYLGKKFSHCGVDAFQLIRNKDGRWKIFHLADTRRKVGCEVPALVSDQFK